MKVGIIGGSGLLGTAVMSALGADGIRVTRFVRRETRRPDETQWNPEADLIDSGALEECHAIIHLSGASITSRWTAANKKRIWNSRVGTTELIARGMAALPNPSTRTLLCASAVGFYGDGGDKVLTESSARGTGYLAELCEAWEQAADPAREAGVRVVHLRLGVVLASTGGALPKMLPAFRLGLGGRLAKGTQFFPWIHLADAVAAIRCCLDRDDLRGPVNLVAPQAISNHEFTKALGRALKRPTLFAVPGFVMRLALGQMASEVLLAGQRTKPVQLTDAGYVFKWPDIDEALADALGTTEAAPSHQ